MFKHQFLETTYNSSDNSKASLNVSLDSVIINGAGTVMITATQVGNSEIEMYKRFPQIKNINLHLHYYLCKRIVIEFFILLKTF